MAHVIGRTCTLKTTSTRVFISHASEDKPRVRPLVQALALEGLSLWLDRPGSGANNFQLDEAFIRRYDIQGLLAGEDWDDQLLEAHRTCGAVLACISDALCKDRHVLADEIVLARYAGKLVACRVDNLAYGQLPMDLGLLDGSKVQAPRVNTAIIEAALQHLAANPSLTPDSLPEHFNSEWQIVRQLVSDINRVIRAQGGTRVSAAELEEARTLLRTIPVGPMVRAYEVPFFLYGLLSSSFPDAAAAKQHFTLAMSLAIECADSVHTTLQVAVSLGEVINPEFNPLDQFWADALMKAGRKSRRTLAALLVAPGPLMTNALPEHTAKELSAFLSWLQNPLTSTH
ncbi:hypothetical protein D3C76_764310 [compost metagenome]